jgi:hypothetical protein
MLGQSLKNKVKRIDEELKPTPNANSGLDEMRLIDNGDYSILINVE